MTLSRFSYRGRDAYKLSRWSDHLTVELFFLVLLPSESYFDVYSRPVVEFKLNETRNETITYDDKRRTIPPWRIVLHPINLIRALYRASIPSNPTNFIVRHIGRVVTFFYEEEESRRIIPFAVKSLLLICPKTVKPISNILRSKVKTFHYSTFQPLNEKDREPKTRSRSSSNTKK